MKSKLVWAAERTFVLVLDPGDEALASITQFAIDNQLGAASLTAIGAPSSPVATSPIRLSASHCSSTAIGR